MSAAEERAAPDVGAAVRAAESRSAAVLSIVGMAIMGVVLFFIQTVFDPIVRPAWRLDAWMIYMLAVVGFWAAAMLGFLLRRPDDAEMARLWSPIGRAAQTGLNIGIALCPWVLLPAADPALRSLMIVLLVWFVATEVMTSSQATAVPVWEVVMLMGSTIAFVLWSGQPYAGVLAFFLAMIGLTMLGLRSLVRQTAVRAIEAKILSERAAAITRAERDAKTRFIAAASHDLQQPIQAASLFFEQALAGEPAASERATAIAGARAAFASTQALIGDMLDHLRLEAGATAARAERVALGPLIAAVATEQAPAARAAGLRIIAMPSRLAATADPQLLRRALGNLVANAVRHAGGERILIGARGAGATVTLWVIDDGVGIAAADAAVLFDDYAQGRSPGGHRGGFGLGLASARRSLALMGGAAAHHPRWESGAAFSLTLPRG